MSSEEFIFGLLETWTLILVILKYYDLISTSWWWVFAPIWIPLLAGIVLFVIITVIDVLIEVFR